MKDFRKSFPIDFSLYDKDTQNVLYIEDSSDQHLTLAIDNCSTRNIELHPLTGKVSETNYHFALCFREGALSKESLLVDEKKKYIQLENSSSDGWEITPPARNAQGMDVVYLKCKSATKTILPPKPIESKDVKDTSGNPGVVNPLPDSSPSNETYKPLMINFKHVGAEARGGARGTRVMLHSKNMSYADNIEFDNYREIHLGIINHRGKKNIPLQLGFVGGNTVVNDGQVETNLTLRIMNIAPYDPANPGSSDIRFNHETKFKLSFHSGPNEDPFTLVDSVVDAGISIPASNELQVTSPNQDPVWVISPIGPELLLKSKADTNKSDDDHSYVDIEIKGIKTSHQCGQTHLYVHYENIPGYWDGVFVCVIEKSPVKVEYGTMEVYGASSGLNTQLSIIGAGVGPVMGFYVPDIDKVTKKVLGKDVWLKVGAYGGNNAIESIDQNLLILWSTKGKPNDKKEIARFTIPNQAIGTPALTTAGRIHSNSSDGGIFFCSKKELGIGTASSSDTKHIGLWNKDWNNKNDKDNSIAWGLTMNNKADVTIRGKLGVGFPKTHDPAAVIEAASNNNIPTLQLNNGYGSSAGIVETKNQITFAHEEAQLYRHTIKTRHNNSEIDDNAIDFYVWNHGKDTDSTIGTLHTMSLNGGKVGIGGITDPKASLDVKGSIICEFQGENNYSPGLTVKNGRIWSDFVNGGLLVGHEQKGFFGMAGTNGVGIWNEKGWGLTVDAEQNATVWGKLFIKKVDLKTPHSKEDPYLVHDKDGELKYFDPSDQRLKQNISTLPNAIQAIQALRGVSYEWNEEGLKQKTKDVEHDYRAASNTPEDNAKVWGEQKQRIRKENSRTFKGFIAQEVEAIFPEWVKENEDGYKTINMDELAPVMVEAIKEQQQQINSLQEQLKMLMKEVAEMKSKSMA